MTTMTDLPTVNQELFTKIRDQIEAYPDTHNQAVWESSYCNTTRCTAGWAIHFTHPNEKDIYTSLNLHYTRDGGFENTGKKLLGLTDDEAEYLFYTSEEEALAMIQHYADNGRDGFIIPEEDEDY